MDVLFLRQRNKGGSDVRVNERVQTTRQFQSGKNYTHSAWISPMFKRRKSDCVLIIDLILFLWESSDHLKRDTRDEFH